MFDKEYRLIDDSQNYPGNWTYETVYKIVEAPFNNFFFPWIIIIIIINRKNLNNSINFILIFHYIFRSLGYVFRKLADAYPINYPAEFNYAIWPYSKIRYTIGCIFAMSFWIIGEIIGDWYPTVRTCKIVHVKWKKLIVKVSCIIYNITKLFTIMIYIYHGKDFEFSQKSEDGRARDNIILDKILMQWWIIVILNFFFGVINDACIIYALKTEVFDKLKTFNKRSYGFIEKFKQISEFRILTSMIISICYMLIFIPILIAKYHEVKKLDRNFNSVLDEYKLNDIREAVLFFNHIMMYIDQILLKYISTLSSKSKEKIPTKTATSISNSTISSNYSSSPY
ncbi:hypothetical protein BCR32DRAFT_269170 [Anaeromyces robustus]|uniref:G-protein coupled receptors family 1 profile domain-containing protein n=1 Tax=Anaeromyces robustus TaxID=1754192 RepID=A0A1Y1X251_9FUNG|nr:hypothetical protein BCR32DRAFT_269170 [Anaeromyces robustus]|eukprot:ORX79879.1 hypothetical protein BCR32DRAFT_269170 [Anaeromyces robustus]